MRIPLSMRKNSASSVFFLSVLFLAVVCGRAWPQQPAARGAEAKESETFYVARKAFDDGFYDVCLNLLSRFNQNYPFSPKKAEAELLAGQCFFYQGRYLDALSGFEALSANPQLSKPVEDALFYWIGETHFKSKNFPKAQEYYRMVLDKYQSSRYYGASLYSLGWCFFEERRFKEALEQFSLASQRLSVDDATRGEAAFKAVECLYNLRDHQAVIDNVSSYRKTYPADDRKSAYLDYYAAEAFYYLGKYAEACAGYSSVLSEHAPAQMQALANLGSGWAYLKLKNKDKAQQSFSAVRVEELDGPNTEILLLGKAALAAEYGKNNDALNIYGELLSRSSEQNIAAQSYLGKGDALYAMSHFGESAVVYEEGLKKFRDTQVPDEVKNKLQYGLAWSLLKKGEFRQAISAFSSIAAASNDNLVKIGALCQVGDAYQDSGEYARAFETYRKILKEYPDNVYNDYVQYQLGLALMKASDYEGAVTAFKIARNDYPSSTLLDEISYALGLVYFQKEDYVSSGEVLRGFLSGFRDSGIRQDALYLLGSAFFNLGKFKDAQDVFRDIMKQYPSDAALAQKCEYEIADCFYQMGDEKEAMRRFNLLRSKYPDSTLTPEIIWWLGEYYYRHGDLVVSRRYFNTLASDFSSSPLAASSYYYMGTIDEEAGRYDQSIENFRKLITGGKSDMAGNASVAVADIYVKQGKAEAAMKVYKEILSVYPHMSGLVFPRMGELYLSAGDKEDAVSSYRQALKCVSFKEMPEIHFKLADILQTQGRQEEAVEEFMKIYAFYPESEVSLKALLRVAGLYEVKEDFKEAGKIYEKISAMQVPEAKYARERLEELAAEETAAKGKKRKVDE
ncbi:MAG: tetratricopeptide repeat protein [Candidatus Omnitrophota bacterium]|jgi:TolA-binding protein